MIINSKGRAVLANKVEYIVHSFILRWLRGVCIGRKDVIDNYADNYILIT